MSASHPSTTIEIPPSAPAALSREDIRTLGLASLGGALEFYDFIIFVFFAPTIGRLFFPPGAAEWLAQVQAFGIFAAGYLARPLGGLLMAHFGDTVGRKRMFTLSVLLMAVPTLLTALLPTFGDLAPWHAGYGAPLALLLMRILQGAAIGGEAPGAWVFVAEHAPRGRVGLACGLLTAGLTGGILLGAVVATVVNSSFSPAALLGWGWRIPFLLGGIFGFGAVILRRQLHETPVFLAIRADAAARVLPLRAVVGGHKPGIAVSMAVTLMLTGAILVVILMTPTLLGHRLHIPPTTMLRANVLACLALTVSAVLTGRALDRFSILPVTLVMGAGLIASTYALYLLGGRPEALVPLYVLAGGFAGIVSVVPVLMVRVFPAPVRFTGLAFSYNLAYAVFGGLTPPLVSALVHRMPLAPAHHVAVATAIGVVGVLVARRLRLI